MSADHNCIYCEYKIYVEKYWKLKQMFSKVRLENKRSKKEITRLQKELDKAYDKIDEVSLNKIDEVPLDKIDEVPLDKIDEVPLDKIDEDDIDKYELV
jgi:hypothetical protein